MTDDKDIVKAVKVNPQKGFRLLMAKYREPLYWHIRRIVVSHDDAEDASQEIFVRIYRSMGQFSESNAFRFRAWIFRIATNEALRLLGRRSGKETMSLDDETSPVPALQADEWMDSSDALAVKLQKAIHTLPVKQQLAFTMRYYDDMLYSEIAEAMNSTATAVKANYHFAKEKIIKYMNEND